MKIDPEDHTHGPIALLSWMFPIAVALGIYASFCFIREDIDQNDRLDALERQHPTPTIEELKGAQQ